MNLIETKRFGKDKNRQKWGNGEQISSQQKNKIQAILDQAKQSIGACSLPNIQSADAEYYNRLQGDEGQASDEKGYYQKYREANAQDTIDWQRDCL